jgi:hypothetical protein
MGNAATALNYASRQDEPARRLRLEENIGTVRVVFPVPPTWTYICPIPIGFGVGSLYVAIWLWSIRFLSLGPSSQQIAVIRHDLLLASVVFVVGAIFWSVSGAYAWRMYYRWGRVPRVLTAGGQGLTISRLGWWHMRERKWPVSEITAIKIRPVRGNLNWKRTVADLSVVLRTGRRLRFRLSSADALLPNQISERVAVALGRPLDSGG